ncbi:DUF6629 family protein [Kitasatospora sp. NPDC054939]
MCWSARADAAAGLLVSGVGIVCVAGAVRQSRGRGRAGLLPLAALPLVLGAHQLVEAVVWLGADGHLSSSSAALARTVWAVIALPLLPVLVPVGVWRADRAAAAPDRTSPDPAAPGRAAAGRAAADAGAVLPGSAARPASGARARAPGWFAVLGAVVAVPLAVAVAVDPVTAREDGHTLAYGVGVPYPAVLLAGYLVATVGSLLVSTDRLLRLLGVLTGAGAVVAALLWRTAFVSTWCALAALVSVVLLRWVGRRPERRAAPPAPRVSAPPAD